MIPHPSPRISAVIAASYRPETRPSRKTSVTTSSVMGEPAMSLPTRTRSKRSARSSLSSQSTSSSQEQQQQQQQLYDHHHHQHSSNPKPADRTLSNPSPAAVARAARPSLASRTSSAPAIPQSQGVSRPGGGDDDDDDNDDEHLDDENDDDDEHHRPTSSDRPQRPQYRSRDSVASIKDDPFFRHYQTPHSVSLGRELMAATYEREEDEDAELVSPLSPPPRPVKKPSVDEGVNLPVSEFPICKKDGADKGRR